MFGLMQQQPLLISSLLVHAERHHPEQEIVSRRVEGDIHRCTYKELASRSRRMARALQAMDVKPSDRVATLAWNGYRHMELYFAVSGIGSVLHTVNPRLHPDQVVWIADHAEDQILFFDLTFLPVIAAVAPRTKTVKHWVAMTDRAHLPEAAKAIPNLLVYEDLIDAQADDAFSWPTFDEQSASSLCYTSGTTGNPKGVLYSHRSTLLHAITAALPDAQALTSLGAILPVVPMFHVNGWGVPYGAPMAGMKLVFPGPALDGKSVYELIEAEQVTMAAGVPTVWLAMLNHVQGNGLRFNTLRRTMIGGSAVPPAMIRAFRAMGVDVLHGWGMTETSPLGTGSSFKSMHAALDEEGKIAVLAKQGRAIFGVDMKVVDPEGRELPWDGKSAGDLLVRGPWVVSSYFRREHEPLLRDGWFPTGDVAAIDEDGFMQITDRSKDVIKSGGEWISSIDIENIAMAHPAVAMAACIAVPHPKWDERPLLVVVRKPGVEVTPAELRAFYDGKVAKWQVPDDVVFVDAIPLGATGKMQKSILRDRFRDHQLPA